MCRRKSFRLIRSRLISLRGFGERRLNGFLAECFRNEGALIAGLDLFAHGRRGIVEQRQLALQGGRGVEFGMGLPAEQADELGKRDRLFGGVDDGFDFCLQTHGLAGSSVPMDGLDS